MCKWVSSLLVTTVLHFSHCDPYQVKHLGLVHTMCFHHCVIAPRENNALRTHYVVLRHVKKTHRNAMRIFRSMFVVGEQLISIFLHWYVCISWNTRKLMYFDCQWSIMSHSNTLWLTADVRTKKIHLLGASTIRLYKCGWCVLTHSMNQLRICSKNTAGKKTAVDSRFHRSLKTHSVNWH